MKAGANSYSQFWNVVNRVYFLGEGLWFSHVCSQSQYVRYEAMVLGYTWLLCTGVAILCLELRQV